MLQVQARPRQRSAVPEEVFGSQVYIMCWQNTTS